MKQIFQYSKDEYKALLEKSSAWKDLGSKPKKIAVVGAGMSGLVSAMLLKRMKHDVDIFEASRSVGGRVKTLREGFSSGFYAEAGAMRIPDNHTLTLSLIKKLKLRTVNFDNSQPNNIIFVNGRRYTREGYQKEPSWLGYKLNPNEQNRTADELFDDVLLQYIRGKTCWSNFTYNDFNSASSDDIIGKKWELLKQLDLFSLRTFLKQQAFLGDEPLSPGAAEKISNVLASEMQMQSSMAEILSDHSEMHGKHDRISILGGMDLLPRALAGLTKATPSANDVCNFINYSRRVTEIRPGDPGVQVIWEHTITREPGNRSYDFVIVSIPFSALRHVYMPGLLTEGKMRAIRQLHYENSCKILLEFKERFWELRRSDERTIGSQPMSGGHSITDLPIRQIYYPAKEHSCGRKGGVLLASYTWGDDSLRWTSLKRDDRVRFALRDLALVHNREERLGVNPLEDICVAGVSHSWAEDEFTSGAFATFEAHQFGDLFDDTWRSNDRVHFCGEHTSTKHGWIEGAVESGIRVAKEVCEAAVARC